MNEEILARVDALAAALGVAASQIWAITVKQAFISGVGMVVLLALGLVLFLIGIAIGIKSRNDTGGIRPVITVVTGVIGVFLLLVSAIESQSTLAALFNPEYWALDDIARKLSRIRR